MEGAREREPPWGVREKCMGGWGPVPWEGRERGGEGAGGWVRTAFSDWVGDGVGVGCWVSSEERALFAVCVGGL